MLLQFEDAEKKIKETMVFFDSAVYFRTKTEEVMTLQ